MSNVIADTMLGLTKENIQLKKRIKTLEDELKVVKKWVSCP